MTTMSGAQIDLQSAADQLGVHYQTAYRWVRSGRLPAHLVKGSYAIDAAAVARVAERRARPTPPPARRPRGGFGELSERALAQLMAGEERAVSRLVGELIASGVTLTRVAQEVLAPALARIGEGWSDGAVTILTEHRSSAIVERVLAEHQPALRGRRRGTAAVAAPTGDRHALPTLMAALALREDSWRVHHLGAEVPAGQFERFCVEQQVDLAVLTVTVEDARASAEQSAAALGARGVRVLVGRPGERLEDLQRIARES